MSRRSLRSILAGVVVGVLAGVGLSGAGVADAGPAVPHPSSVTDVGASRPAGRYLALGDSVSFGFREAQNIPTPDYADAASFVGYPEDVAAALGLRVANASCPGETAASFLDPSAQSNGCENTLTSPLGYRSLYPLHVAYGGSQIDYAVRYLIRHPRTRFVTLTIGANDALLCQARTTDHCAREFPALVRRLTGRIRTIAAALRDRAHYRGPLVVVDYYSTNYADPALDAEVQGLNRAMARGVRPFGGIAADGYDLFRAAAVQAAGNSCRAGLLTLLSTGGCGIHPSVAGQALLAQSVERALAR